MSSTQVTYLLGESAPWLTIEGDVDAVATRIEAGLARGGLLRLLDLKTGQAPLYINPSAVVLVRAVEVGAQWRLADPPPG